jgi:hypothetical protein
MTGGRSVASSMASAYRRLTNTDGSREASLSRRAALLDPDDEEGGPEASDCALAQYADRGTGWYKAERDRLKQPSLVETGRCSIAELVYTFFPHLTHSILVGFAPPAPTATELLRGLRNTSEQVVYQVLVLCVTPKIMPIRTAGWSTPMNWGAGVLPRLVAPPLERGGGGGGGACASNAPTRKAAPLMSS